MKREGGLGSPFCCSPTKERNIAVSCQLAILSEILSFKISQRPFGGPQWKRMDPATYSTCDWGNRPATSITSARRASFHKRSLEDLSDGMMRRLSRGVQRFSGSVFDARSCEPLVTGLQVHRHFPDPLVCLQPEFRLASAPDQEMQAAYS